MSVIDQCPPPQQPEPQVEHRRAQCVEPQQSFYDGITQARISQDRRANGERASTRKLAKAAIPRAMLEQKAMMPAPTTIPTPVPIYTQPPIRIIKVTEGERGENKAPPKRIKHDPVLDIPTTADGTPLALDEDASDLRTYPQDGRCYRFVKGQWIQEQVPGTISRSLKQRAIAIIEAQKHGRGKRLLKNSRLAIQEAKGQSGIEAIGPADPVHGAALAIRKLVRITLAERRRSNRIDRREERRERPKNFTGPSEAQSEESIQELMTENNERFLVTLEERMMGDLMDEAQAQEEDHHASLEDHYANDIEEKNIEWRATQALRNV